MSNKVEILSPAGSPDALIAAVRSGADAVYLGGSAFSARASAKNFSNGALRDAVAYCHARGVKVYLAVNTLLHQDELPEALKLVEFACRLPVDALIVQDLGLIHLLRRCCPEMKMNASTQMSVHTPAGVRALRKFGFGRVVLSRELSLGEIREISQACEGIELESFVHGALCMSGSGQCYFSELLGSRSGNRGQCAQPCRLPFSVPGGTGHDLSLKDLSMISRLEELSLAGVSSAKIEGRMKRPEYVAASTAACRLAADGKQIPPGLMKNLAAVFSRSGFTTGYPDGHLGREMFGVRSKEDVTGATNEVFSELQKLYQKELPRIPVSFSLEIKEGQPVHLTVSDGEYFSSHTAGNPEPAVNHPITPERCRQQLQKTGGTPFRAETISCHIDQGLSIPVSLLNDLRRSCLRDLEEMRSHGKPVGFLPPDNLSSPLHRPGPFRLRARFSHPEQVPDSASQLELVYLPLSTPKKDLLSLKERGIPVAIQIPRGNFGREQQVRDRLSHLQELELHDCWAGTLDAAALALELGFRVHGGFSLNVFNTPALAACSGLGLIDTELSPELTLSQADALGGDLPRGLLVYGRLPLMLCRNCPGKNGSGCGSCTGTASLTDRRGTVFPIQCMGGCSEILNSVPLYFADRMSELRRQDFGTLWFTVEKRVESEEILRFYTQPSAAASVPGSFTRGLFYRGVE